MLAACSAANFDLPSAPDSPLPAYFAEFCALSQILKKPGYGADIRGQIGGHAVFYLHGACRDPHENYPVLELCGPGQEDGVGLSMNEHFYNAKWVATPGRRFFYEGDATAPLTRAGYDQVKREAQRLDIYRGVAFHDVVFGTMPPNGSRRDWMYEVSIATDYAIALGRGRYCARVPVTRQQMAAMIAFLNAENAPYRAGKPFVWSVFRDNCIHLAHNALAAAGLWPRWPTDRPYLISVLDFPVPKNEFVNLMRATNDDVPLDPAAAYAQRDTLLATGELRARPGALASAHPPLRPNEVYDTDVKLVFYDEPNIGRYQPRFDRIFSEPRYTDPAANAAYFDALYRTAAARQRPLAEWVARGHTEPDFPAVYAAYAAFIARHAP